MSETPICDKHKHETDLGAEVVPLYVAIELECKLHDLQYEIGETNVRWLKSDKQLAEARARIDNLERIVDEMTEEQAALCAEEQSITELVAAKDKQIEQMLEALEDARLFIENGIEMGYISEPQPGTLESATLPAIKAAVKAAKGEI